MGGLTFFEEYGRWSYLRDGEADSGAVGGGGQRGGGERKMGGGMWLVSKNIF